MRAGTEVSCPTCGQSLPPKGIFNDASHEVIVNGERRYLGPKCWELLMFFRSRIGRVVTRDMLTDALYEHEADYPEYSKIIDVFLSRVRHALKGTSYRFVCMHRIGWRLEHEPR